MRRRSSRSITLAITRSSGRTRTASCWKRCVIARRAKRVTLFPLPGEGEGARVASLRLLDNRPGCGFDTGHFDGAAIQHGGNFGGDVIFPMLAFVHRFVQSFSFLFALEAPYPYV